MKITESLKNVYTAMGGADAFPIDDIAEGINQISEVAGSGGGGVVIVNMAVTTGEHSETYYTLDKTWKEIHDAFVTGTIVFVMSGDASSYEYDMVTGVLSDDGFYAISIGKSQGVSEFTCNSEDGYPQYMSV